MASFLFVLFTHPCGYKVGVSMSNICHVKLEGHMFANMYVRAENPRLPTLAL